MATKKLILRPTGCWGTDASNFTPEPADTLPENYYILVAEETHDSDSTYLSITGSLPTGGFTFNSLDGFSHITPLSINIIAVARTSIENSVVQLCYVIPDDTSTTGRLIRYSEKAPLSLNYKTYNFVIPEEDLLLFWELIESEGIERDYYSVGFACGSENSGSKAKSDVIVTQCYIEVEYETGPDIYIKEGLTWSHTTGTIYKKINSFWTEISEDELQNNTRYKISKINQGGIS